VLFLVREIGVFAMRKLLPTGVIAEDDLDLLRSVFHLLSDKTRLRTMMLLAEGERNVTSLCESLGLPQPTVSHHLGLLRTRNLVNHRRQGKQVFYSLNGTASILEDQQFELLLDRFSVRLGMKVNE
jgi:DNA-binding transcriptional ArsR family regulator